MPTMISDDEEKTWKGYREIGREAESGVFPRLGSFPDSPFLIVVRDSRPGVRGEGYLALDAREGVVD